MERRKRVICTVVTVAVVLAVAIGWQKHRMQQNIQNVIQQYQDGQRQERAQPGVVVDPDGTIRWGN
ncbi:hypothetical protein GC163_12285 [bacterium]|nr:hypothetical protein [bacterium]